MLLPWYVNGTLDATEAALFEAHLAQCEECRADLAANRALREAYAEAPVTAEPVRASPLERLPLTRKARTARWRRPLQRRVGLGWALAGQAAVAATVAAAFLAFQAPAPPAHRYNLLGADAAAQHGNVIVLFAPDTAERDLRAALEAHEARLVDGPTASGAYVLRVADDARPAALENLRALPQIVLAEPIDAGGAP